MKFTYRFEEDGVVIGKADLLWGEETSCEIIGLTVELGHRNKGVGSSIMTRICADADAEGERLYLYCCPDPGRRADLIRFYERFGFVARNPSARCPNMERKPVKAVREA